jgi:alpha-galactosidase
MRALSMTLIHGVPALMQDGKALLTGLQAGIMFDGGKSNRQIRWCQGTWTLCGDAAQGEVSCADARIEYHREGEGMALRTFYTHSDGNIQSSEQLIALHGIWCCGFDRCLYNDFSSANGALVNEMGSSVHTLRLLDGEHLSGAENMALIDAEGRHLLAGFLSFEKMFPAVRVGSEGKLRFWQQTEHRPLTPEQVLESDWMYIGICDDVRQGLVDYARLAGRYMNTRAGIFDTPYGYCTWYYYGNGLRPQTVYENLRTLRENEHRLGVKYFNLDNGWLKAWGDWTENEKFACGMKKIADDIYAEGYLPGIWLAPFGAEAGAPIFDGHPDWFVQRWDGKGPVERMYGSRPIRMLDMSHPEVKQFIRDTFHRLTHEWGYRHVKIDMITCTIAPGKYHDPSYTSLMNYREGLRLMRESMSEDAVLLACTAPMGASIGYADGMRTSGDIFHDWNSIRNLFTKNLKRYYYNKTWFCTDPDCLIVRNAENEDDECIRPCIRTDTENRTFATVVMATGGAMIMSDKMPLLKEYQLQLLSWMYPINTQAAIPLDLMDSQIPGKLDLGRRGQTHLFALVNWTDVKKAMTLDIGAGHVFEFWSQQYLGFRCGTAAFEVEPHGALILCVTDDAPIAAVGVDDCLCPTMEQVYCDGLLTARFLKKGEKMHLVSRTAIEAAEGCTVETVCAERGWYTAVQTGNTLECKVRIRK